MVSHYAVRAFEEFYTREKNQIYQLNHLIKCPWFTCICNLGQRKKNFSITFIYIQTRLVELGLLHVNDVFLNLQWGFWSMYIRIRKIILVILSRIWLVGLFIYLTLWLVDNQVYGLVYVVKCLSICLFVRFLFVCFLICQFLSCSH